MKTFSGRLMAFFFAPRSATGFGLMRIAWGTVALIYLLLQWRDVTLFYSDAGILPQHLVSLFLRSAWRFTLLDVFTDPLPVFLLYFLLLVLLMLTIAGWKTRWTMIGSFVLLLSFHERNPLPLAGGDTMLRLIGFILAISPGISAVSIDRLRCQWAHWRRTKELLPPLQMPMWPYVLLLWQLIILYGTSLWYKVLGDMWLSGTAVATALHHPVFVRLPLPLMDLLAPLTPVMGYVVLLWHAGWTMLLIPRRTFENMTGLPKGWWKRWLLLAGVFFHGSIFLLLHAGSFSWAVLSGYLGLLDEHDFTALRRCINGPAAPRKVTVLYDGRCGLCLRSIFVLQLFDSLRRLRCMNFWNRHAKNAVAPQLNETQLDRAMHIKERGRFFKGFDAFRRLAVHLPPLWSTVPFLHLPGVAPIGRYLYARIADRRKRCKHRQCAI